MSSGTLVTQAFPPVTHQLDGGWLSGSASKLPLRIWACVVVAMTITRALAKRACRNFIS